jgi:hypothetical protein
MNDEEMLRSSDRHFARKFDPKVDSDILDLLDSWRARPEAAAILANSRS